MLVKIITTIFILMFLDSIYFYVNKDFFSQQILDVQGTPVSLKLFPAFLCYVALAFGINYFILREKKSLLDAFLLGFVIYAVYETTNKATLKKWTNKIVVIDTLWGGILFTLTTIIMRKIHKF